MAWLRVDDGFAEHPKLIALGGRADRWTWLELLGYCARRRTRGRVPARIGDVLRHVTPAFLRRCIEVGLLDDTENGYVVHDWNVYNGDTIEEQINAYLASNPDASANEVWRAIGGKREVVLGIYKRIQRFPTGSQPGSQPGTQAVPDSGQAVPEAVPLRARARTPAQDPVTNLEPLSNPTPFLEQTHDPNPEDERKRAWIDYARNRDDVKAPAKYADAGFKTGDWPPGQEPRKQIDPINAATNWIRGAGWDETFTAEMVAEEFNRIAHLAHTELHARDCDDLLEQWQAERARRYPEVPA